MAKRRHSSTSNSREKVQSPAVAHIPPEAAQAVEAVAGIPGPGRWLVFDFVSTSLFSLKRSDATSSVGRTHVIPTPYSVKMAFLSASLRLGGAPDGEVLVVALRDATFRIGVPRRAIVTHTIVKVRQEPKVSKPTEPYIPAIAFREFAFLDGPLSVAVDLISISEPVALQLVQLAPMISYLGKRGSFFQYLEGRREEELDTTFTQPVAGILEPPPLLHFAHMDDFGPEATFDSLNSYNSTSIRRDKHRSFVETVIPLGLINSGPGFSEFSAETNP